MTRKNPNIISLSGITPELKEKLEKVADRRGISVSKLVRDMLTKQFCSNDDVHTVILSVPADLKGEPDELKKWLDVKTAGIVKTLASS